MLRLLSLTELQMRVPQTVNGSKKKDKFFNVVARKLIIEKKRNKLFAKLSSRKEVSLFICRPTWQTRSEGTVMRMGEWSQYINHIS